MSNRNLTQDVWGSTARDGSARHVGGRAKSVDDENRLYQRRAATPEVRAIMGKFGVTAAHARKILAAARRQAI